MKRLNALSAVFALSVVLGTVLATAAAQKLPELNADAPGSVQLRNKKFGELLRPEDANGATGTRIVLYPAQPWKCMTWKLHPAGESAYHLQNHFTSKTFAAGAKADQPGAVTQVPLAKDSSERPVWRFTKLQDGNYKITEAKTGQALTAVKEDNALKIIVQAWQGTDAQKWQLLPIDPKQLTM